MNRTIELEDHGQDFLRLLIDSENVITGAEPFQGWVWKGSKVLQKRIRPGMRLRLSKRGWGLLILNYPVLSVHPTIQ